MNAALSPQRSNASAAAAASSDASTTQQQFSADARLKSPPSSPTEPVTDHRGGELNIGRTRSRRARSLASRLANLLHRDTLVFLLIAAPLATCYFGWIWADQYVSEAVVSLRTVAADTGDDSALALLGLASRSRSESAGLREYMLSAEMALQMDRELGLRERWSSPRFDWFSRLAPDAQQEDFIEYYRSSARIELDDLSGALRIRAFAFDPSTAQRLAVMLVERTDSYANYLTHTMMAEQLRFVVEETSRAQARLNEARKQLAAHVNAFGVLGIEQRVATEAALNAKLEQEHATAMAELSAATSYLTPAAAQLATLKARGEAIAEQLRKARARLRAMDQSLPAQAVAERELRERVAFLEELVRRTMQAEEKARIESSRRAKTLAVLAKPVLAIEPRKPRRVAMILTSWLAIAAMWALYRLARTLILERRQ